jgi:hypothetical protein
MLPRFAGVGGQRFVSVEMLIALDGKSKWAAKVAQFMHADEAKFWASHAKIARTEGDIVEPEFRQ